MASINERNIFNKHRLLALIFLLIGSIIFWYALVLLTNPTQEKPIPDKLQLLGLLAAILIAFISWISKCLTIIPA